MIEMPPALENRGAYFSPCRTWRYKLWRIWEPQRPIVNFIGLNPSTADENRDDPTIRRCIAFARRWGCGGLYMTNLFALRSTEPAGLRRVADPWGPANAHWLRETAQVALESGGLVVCAWGVHGAYLDVQDGTLDGALRGLPLHVLGLTRDGYSRHPLYLRADTEPVPWR